MEIFFKYILPSLMSIGLFFIAYQQLITNKDKLKLELYKNRFEIYEITLLLYQELSKNGAESNTLRRFIAHKESATFLFSNDQSIYDLLNEIHGLAIKINSHKQNNNISSSMKNTMSTNSQLALTDFGNKLPVLSKKLKPYLSFEK